MSSQKSTMGGGEEKLFMRFYESLVLLHTLDPNNGERIPSSGFVDEAFGDSELDLRRNFLKYLAYVCDYDTGGETVTAIALQETHQQVVYWIAANRNPLPSKAPSVYDFLGSILQDLQILSNTEDINDFGDFRAAKKQEIAARCVEFGNKRIDGYLKRLRRQLAICLEALDGSRSSKDRELAISLRTLLQNPSYFEICSYCHDVRHQSWMKDLASRAISTQKISKGDSNAAAFGLVRHYIGRLCCYIRAAEIFIAASSRMPYLFDRPSIEVIPSSQFVKVPLRSESELLLKGEFTLDGILKRMLAKHEPRHEEYRAKLASLDQKFKIFERLREQLESKELKSRVHAELLVLEHFNFNQFRFVADDKFIGCSKPACYCCYRYIREHDEGFVLPSSHHKTYLSWRPPDIPNDENSERRWKAQREIMIRVIRDINSQVLRKIRQCHGPNDWRPDSTTGITSSLRAIGLQETENSYNGSSMFHSVKKELTHNADNEVLGNVSTTGSVDVQELESHHAYDRNLSDPMSEDYESPYATANEDPCSGTDGDFESEVDSDSEPEGGVSLPS